MVLFGGAGDGQELLGGGKRETKQGRVNPKICRLVSGQSQWIDRTGTPLYCFGLEKFKQSRPSEDVKT